MTDLMQPPKRPICKDPDGTPCAYATVCHASRQLVQAGWHKSLGQWVRVREPIRGMECWAFQMISQRPSPRSGLAGDTETPKGEAFSSGVSGAPASPPDSERAA